MKQRENNFVAPLPQPHVEIVESPLAHLPAPPQTVLLPTANYTDRARGFSLATAPLASVAGLTGILGWQVPIASLITLLLALGGFAAVWFAAYIIHTVVSPDGATFFHVVLAWRFLRAEQQERHRRYREVSK